MAMTRPSLPILLLFLNLLGTNLVASQGTGTVSMYEVPALNTVRPCATSCMYTIVAWIECPRNLAYDACFCRNDLTAAGRSELFACITRSCINGNLKDASDMTSIYSSYCSEYNALAAPAPTAAEPTTGEEPGETSTVGDGEGETSTVVRTSMETVTTRVGTTVSLFTGAETVGVRSTVTRVVVGTFTTVLDGETLESFAAEYEKGRNGGGGGGLEKGYRVAIAVGVVAAVIIALLLFMNKIRRRWFGYKGPYENAPVLPMGGIEGTGGGRHGLGMVYHNSGYDHK
ncbi:hypothetical protein ABW19_dt0200733 [Dactylella cylindrospora]|nr:hypothetical protein ABW19_dt0200733 [Dactylella cylindrospora]